jgi:hypothetical protein
LKQNCPIDGRRQRPKHKTFKALPYCSKTALRDPGVSELQRFRPAPNHGDARRRDYLRCAVNLIERGAQLQFRTKSA